MESFKWRMRIISLIGLISFLFVVNFLPIYADQKINNNPQEIISMNIALFYFSLGILMTGIFSLILIWYQRKIRDEESALDRAVACFRQGLLLSVMIVVALLLQSFRMLVWWDALLVVGAILAVELYFLSHSSA